MLMLSGRLVVVFAVLIASRTSALVSCVFDGVGELFVECVCYLLVCGGCFVSEFANFDITNFFLHVNSL